MNKTEWDESHKFCPNCGSEKISTSSMEVNSSEEEYADMVNTAKCDDCGWKGMRKNLVGNAEDSRTIKVELKTMDKDGEVYISCWDLVGALKQYQAGVLGLLGTKEQADFTNALFEEIYKTIISSDYQHRVMKEMAALEAEESESSDTEINEEK